MEKDFNLVQHCVRVSVEDMDGIIPNFSCGNADLDDFFHNDALPYAEEFLMVLADNPEKIVCAFTVSNDSVKMALVPTNKIKNGFRYFYDSEEQEKEAFHISSDEELHQRLMIFDLIALSKKTRQQDR